MESDDGIWETRGVGIQDALGCSPHFLLIEKYTEHVSQMTISHFCLRRSPDHGTVDVVVVVVLVLVGGTTLVFDFFQDTEIFIK